MALRSRSRMTSSAACMALLGLPALAQNRTTFSIDNQGPSVGSPACSTSGGVVVDSDVLISSTPSGTPIVAAPMPPCVEIAGGFGAGTFQLALYPVQAEVNALSYGMDAQLEPTMPPGSVWFSTDEFAIGYPLTGFPEPNLQSESVAADHGSSVFIDLGLPTLPAAWGSGPLPNVQAIDGDGKASLSGYTTPGLGIIEPNPPGSPPDLGDNLDALDVHGVSNNNLVLFSLAPPFFDNCSTAFGADSGPPHGFSPAAIVATNLAGGAPVLWTAPGQLGLDGAGFATDNIDALAVWDNGNRLYNRALAPFDWNVGMGDMVLFSVSRNSAVIGQPDSLNGDPIEESDILMPPVAGGVSGFPAIIIPGECLGMATRRSLTARLCGLPRFADDLDALDITKSPVFDCNANGVEDALDIAATPWIDANRNGVPESCERPVFGVAGVDLRSISWPN